MINLYPLRLSAADSSRYHFLFETADGPAEFQFQISMDDNNNLSMDRGDVVYGDLTSGDVADLLIAKCIFRFHKARLEATEETFLPTVIKYLGHGPDFTFNYAVEGRQNLKDRIIHVKVIREVPNCKMRLESELGIFDSYMGINGHILLSDQTQQYANLMQAVLFFDTACDFRLDETVPVFQLDMRYEGMA